MGYRKFKADLLFDGTQLLDNTYVLITHENGEIASITPATEAGENIETFTGLLTPGFINTHCHLELSHMKDLIPEGTGLVDFLLTVIKKRTFPQHIIEEAMVNAVNELYDAGTAGVGDICNTAHSLPVKTDRRIAWMNFIEVLGFTKEPEDRFRFASALLQEFNHFADLINLEAAQFTTALAPHAPYSVAEKLFRLINNASYEVTSIHNQECKAENEFYRSKTGEMLRLYDALKIDVGFFHPSGKSSLQTFLPLLDNPANILLVHNSYINDEDFSFLKTYREGLSQELFFVVCVNANQYIESTLPPLLAMKEQQLPICLGTDSYASNRSLNLLEEMKTIQRHFPGILLETLLTWATSNGAKALRMDELAGSFAKGKSPGIVHVSGINDRRLTAASVSKRIL